MGSVYDLPGVMVCIIRGEMFNPAKKAKMVMSSFGTRIKDFDILTAVKNEGVLASGFASKANVELESETAAIEAVKKAITDFNSAEDALVIIRGAINVSAVEEKFRKIFKALNDWAYIVGGNGPGAVPGKKGNFLWLTLKKKTDDGFVFDYNGGPNAIWGTITVTPTDVIEKNGALR